MKSFFLLFLPFLGFGQVLISADTEVNPTPDPSAMLELKSPKHGVSLQAAMLKSPTDVTTISNPAEGLVVLNASTSATEPLIPSSKPTVVVWDGTKWLFGFKEDDSLISLDFIKNYNADNGSNVVTFDNSFPAAASNPASSYGEVLNTTGATAWKVLITTDVAGKTQPSFRFTNIEADQRIIVDAEGIAAVNNNVGDYNNRFTYAYEVGIFSKSALSADYKLVSAQKFIATTLAGACSFHKYNITAILDDQTFFNNVPANTGYNFVLAVRPLSKVNTLFNRMVFGSEAGIRINSSPPSTCGNLNAHTARSYMNILTIEKKK